MVLSNHNIYCENLDSKNCRFQFKRNYLRAQVSNNFLMLEILMTSECRNDISKNNAIGNFWVSYEEVDKNSFL